MASHRYASKEIERRPERLPTDAHSTYAAVQSAQLLEQPVEFVQSQELVQITVCAVVSTISSLRCLFPDDCFKVHYYDIENSSHSYREFKEAVSDTSVTAMNGRK